LKTAGFGKSRLQARNTHPTAVKETLGRLISQLKFRDESNCHFIDPKEFLNILVSISTVVTIFAFNK